MQPELVHHEWVQSSWMDIESLKHSKVRYDVLNELDLIELHQVNIKSNVLALD